MGQKNASKWMHCLPWVLLGRRTAFRPTLNAAPADLDFGGSPRIPGDLLDTMDQPVTNEQDLLKQIQQKVAGEPAQTDHHRQLPTYWPSSATKATHVYTQKGKPSPLGPLFEGPFEILERLGDAYL